jgi:CRISPR system Cascade subunit CasB
VNNDRPGDPTVDTFVTELEKLAAPGSEDRASLARLKRAVGRSLAESTSLMPFFYRRLPPTVRGRSVEESYFLVATLFPFAPGRWEGDLGVSLGLLRARSGISEEGVDRRVAVLLDAASPELPFRLRQMVCLLAHHGLPLDWRRLLEDLRWWDHPERWVQKRWARSYFGGQKADARRQTPDASGDG